ncbi:hypothetical protein D3C76_1851380 [compost metagenome]
MHARFNRAEYVRVTGQGCARQNNLLAVDRVVVRAFGRKTGDFVADNQVFNALAQGSDDTGHFLANA